MKEYIENSFKEISGLVSGSANLAADIENIAKEFVAALKRGNKIILFGNGGSASDAEHIAAELIGKFEKRRMPLAAVSLTTNTSALTAIANDFSYQEVFSVHLEAIAKAGDIAVGISTSGKSPNVVTALQKAKELKLFCVSFTGRKPNEISGISDICLGVDSTRTCRIQEVHILSGHIICGLVEKALF